MNFENNCILAERGKPPGADGASEFAKYECVSDFSLAIIKSYNNIRDINLNIPRDPYRTVSANAHFAARLKFSLMMCGTHLTSRHFIVFCGL